MSSVLRYRIISLTVRRKLCQPNTIQVMERGSFMVSTLPAQLSPFYIDLRSLGGPPGFTADCQNTTLHTLKKKKYVFPLTSILWHFGIREHPWILWELQLPWFHNGPKVQPSEMLITGTCPTRTRWFLAKLQLLNVCRIFSLCTSNIDFGFLPPRSRIGKQTSHSCWLCF